MKILTRPLIAALLGLIALQAWHYAHILPRVIASHFDVSGAPNGSVNRDAFLVGYLAIAAFVAISPWIYGGFLRQIPARFINLPNAAWWLAPGRRELAIAGLAPFVDGSTCLTMAFLAAVGELVFRANLPGGAFDSRGMIALLAAFFAGTFAGILALYRAFRIPEEARLSAGASGKNA